MKFGANDVFPLINKVSISNKFIEQVSDTLVSFYRSRPAIFASSFEKSVNRGGIVAAVNKPSSFETVMTVLTYSNSQYEPATCNVFKSMFVNIKHATVVAGTLNLGSHHMISRIGMKRAHQTPSRRRRDPSGNAGVPIAGLSHAP